MEEPKDIDGVLELIDENEEVQKLMAKIVLDIQNRNKRLLHEVLRQYIDNDINRLLEIVKGYIERNKTIFNDPGVKSKSDRIDYQHILFHASSGEGTVAVEKLTRWLAVYLLSEHIPGIGIRG